MPPNTVYVGRPTEWGNPFKVGQYYAPGQSFEANYGHLMDEGRVTDANVLTLFEEYCRRMLAHGGDWLSFLRGKNLACWCSLTDKNGNPVPCHADVLLRLANSEPLFCLTCNRRPWGNVENCRRMGHQLR